VKICPNCAEQNEDEAVICHYCWHELPPSINPSLSVLTKRSVWVTGASWAAIFTALEAIGAAVRYYYSPYELLGTLAIGAIPSFIFWWVICTLVIWLWRMAGNRRLIKIGILISIILSGITLGVGIDFLMKPIPQVNSAPQVDPTEMSIGSPTPNPLGACLSWDTITLGYAGQTFCIFGKVSEFGGTVILFSRINSQVRIIYRPVGTYIHLSSGDCIYATGLITNENGVLMLTTSQIDYCPPGFNP